MANILDLPLHSWQSIGQYLIYSHQKPTDFLKSLAQFRDIMRLRGTCTTARDLIDDCCLLFALSNWCAEEELVKFDSALSFMSESNWKFYWLHLGLHGKPRKELMPLIGYEKLFANSLQVLKIDNWFVFKSEDFKFLDAALSPAYEPLCNNQTRLEIELIKIGDHYNAPALRSAELVTSLDILSSILASDLHQLALAFRETLLTIEIRICR